MANRANFFDKFFVNILPRHIAYGLTLVKCAKDLISNAIGVIGLVASVNCCFTNFVVF